MVLKRFFAFAVVVLLCGKTAFAADNMEIKFALLAPEGSTWAKIIHEWDAQLQKKTGGRLKLKIYAGGVLGDERDVIRKMRIGQVHAGAFTSLGLGFINPEVRVLDLPFLFRSYDEVDAVAKRIQPKLEPAFQKKGFVLLSWTETGFVNIFSNKPITSRKDLKGVKMWAWEGDQLVEVLCKHFGIVPIPLALPDVLTSLQTNLIDAVYAPPLGAIALQWFTRTKYLTDLKLANSTGGILISKQAFQRLTPADREVLRSTAHTFSQKLITQTRKENEASYAALKKAGLKMVKIKPEEALAIETQSAAVWKQLVGVLYPASLLAEVQSQLETFRKGHGLKEKK